MTKSILSINERHTKVPLVSINPFKSDSEQKVTSTEFFVDNKPLSELVATPDLITLLNSEFVKDERFKYVKRLLGEAPADCANGRTALYVCPIDGDIACGAVACKVTLNKDTVKWSDFAWVQDEDDPADGENNRMDDEPSFVFDRKQYEIIMKTIIADL